MVIIGAHYVQAIQDRQVASAKMVFNACGAIIFPVSEEHRNQKAPGISYEDNHEGNALAAMVRRGQIEVRFHNRFADSQVRSLLSQMALQPQLSMMRPWRVTYQGRVLATSTDNTE